MLSARPVHYEIGGHPDVMNYGGIAVAHRLVTKLGLPEQIDQRLHLLKVHLPYHESDHVLNLSYNALCGGTRLQDIEIRRHDTAYMKALGTDLIPDPTTAGDFCRRFEASDVVELMEAINAVRPKLWQGRGRDLLGPVAYLDVDGVLAPTGGERKAGMEISYKGIWGYHPLVVSLANTKEVLYVVNRPGNVPSHTDAARWLDKAIALLTPHAPRVCLRGDTDFSLTAHFDRWAKQVDFVFGMDCNAALRGRAEALDEAAWQRLERKPRDETAPGPTQADPAAVGARPAVSDPCGPRHGSRCPSPSAAKGLAEWTKGCCCSDEGPGHAQLRGPTLRDTRGVSDTRAAMPMTMTALSPSTHRIDPYLFEKHVDAFVKFVEGKSGKQFESFAANPSFPSTMPLRTRRHAAKWRPACSGSTGIAT